MKVSKGGSIVASASINHLVPGQKRSPTEHMYANGKLATLHNRPILKPEILFCSSELLKVKKCHWRLSDCWIHSSIVELCSLLIFGNPQYNTCCSESPCCSFFRFSCVCANTVVEEKLWTDNQTFDYPLEVEFVSRQTFATLPKTN